MASYRQPCLHCQSFIDRDARACPSCGSLSPFGYHCPDCLRAISTNERVCAGCGRPLVIVCPHCAKPTFVADRCQHCAQSLMVACANPRCGAPQFFQNMKCTACGKKINHKK